ncbi:hypothetical protein HUN08_13215 [Gordonia sp. X0973]|uniref:hypothetical protein n=1 Tax=Gordonia sp. X0973 TaxID=2742602 RepID=UPI000F5413A8|nr:hypothetical protein [Gordonia sp. X0973]QKT08035.1 hypothetical protein HUN08_13215 [Gordonia sp. X0973]
MTDNTMPEGRRLVLERLHRQASGGHSLRIDAELRLDDQGHERVLGLLAGYIACPFPDAPVSADAFDHFDTTVDAVRLIGRYWGLSDQELAIAVAGYSGGQITGLGLSAALNNLCASYLVAVGRDEVHPRAITAVLALATEGAQAA